MFNKFTIFNRPIAPHLLIYTPQLSSLFSIWHRISGIILISSLTFFLIFLKINSNLNFGASIYFLKILFIILNPQWIFNFFYLLILITLLYHSLNGIRHIIWDLGFFLDVKYLFKSSFVIIFLIFMILALNLLNL